MPKPRGKKNQTKKTASTKNKRAALTPPFADANTVLLDRLFSNHSKSWLYVGFLTVCSLLGLYLLFQHLIGPGVAILLSVLALLFAEPFFRKMASFHKFALIVLGLLLTADSLAVIPDYGAVMPQGLVLHVPDLSGVFFVAGCFLMLVGFRFSNYDADTSPDLKPWQTYLSLAVIIGCGAAMTLSHFGEVMGYYWDDTAEIMLDIRSTKELHFYSIIMPFSFREPTFNYLATLVWYLFSGLTGMSLQRIVSVFIYLLTILAMYFLGAKVANRRVGLLFAALGAFNKWLPTETLWGYGLVLNPLMISASFLALFRLF